MREVGLFIKVNDAYKRLELFNDENIDFSSSIQNVQDISKVFSDFTQGFTIPATPYNASILNWFEESSISQIFDYQQSFESYIEIDTIPFTKGKLKVDKGQLKDGKPYCYNVQFFGHLTSLKDTFGELKLSDLDLTPYSFAYDDTQVLNRITDGTTDYDVRFPLISSSRFWTYDDGTPNDISTIVGEILLGELLPAIKVDAIMSAIQSQFDLTFDSIFFQTKLFQRLFLYLKNANNSTVRFNFDNVTFDSSSGSTDFRTVDIPNSTLNYTFGNLTIFGSTITNYQYQTSINITSVTSALLNWSVQCFRNNILVNTIQGQGTGEYVIFTEQNVNGLDANLTFSVNSERGNTIDFEVKNSMVASLFVAVPAPLNTTTIVCDTFTPNLDINLYSLCRDIKISDFFSVVLRMFNLTVNPISETEFKIETLESWYSKGRISDITLNTNDTFDVSRVRLYNQIDFKYQQSETILNRRYFSNNQREYGNVRNAFENDGSEFKIELPFENVLQQKFTDTEIQVGYCVDSLNNAITPKPMLIYMNDEIDITTTPIKFYDGTTIQTLTSYLPFGQDLIWNASNYSLNWGAEISSFYLNTISNSLFATYWSNYLSGLYDLRQRLYTYKTMLPISKLTTLQLNDRLVIEDKRYIINDYKSNLTTGLVELNLIQDFRDILTPLIFNLSNEAQCIEVMIFIPNGANSFEPSTTTSGVSFSFESLTQDTLLTICIPESGETTITTEDEIDITTESGETLITEDSASGTITITITYDNGITNTIIITRNA
jgi:hypothetical protein